MITCDQVMKALEEGIDPERRDAHLRSIEAHLESCPDCQQCAELLAKTVAYYREYIPSVPVDLHTAILDKLGVN